MYNNKIELIGNVVKTFKYEYSMNNENFYSLFVKINRNSGCCDVLKLICSDKTIDISKDLSNKIVSVSGTVRTRNDKNKKLQLYVFVDELYLLHINGNECIGENIVKLNGYICKNDQIRYTPSGRIICNQILAVHRNYNKSDYIPIIIWGRNAQYSSTLPVGENIEITGRLQSRAYDKDNETKVTYEVSVQDICVAM